MLAPATGGEAGGAEQTQVVYIPPQTAPGLGPPRTWNGAWIQLLPQNAELNNGEYSNNPRATLSGGGQMEQGHPGRGDPFMPLVLFFAYFLTSAFSGQRGLYALLFTRFQVKGVAFDLFDNVFLLHFALEAA